MLHMQHQIAPAALLRHSTPQYSGHGLPRGLGYDVEAISADQLIRLVTENRPHCGAAESIEALGIDFPDPFLRCLGDGTKPLLAGAKSPLRLHAIGDVLNLVDEVMRFAGLQPYQGAAQLRPHHAPVLADIALVGLIGIDRPCQHPAHLGGIGVAVVRIGDRLNVGGKQLAFAVADDVAQGGIDREPAAIRCNQRRTDG